MDPSWGSKDLALLYVQHISYISAPQLLFKSLAVQSSLQDCMGRLRERASMLTVPAPVLGLTFHREDGGHSFLRHVQATRGHISEDTNPKSVNIFTGCAYLMEIISQEPWLPCLQTEIPYRSCHFICFAQREGLCEMYDIDFAVPYRERQTGCFTQWPSTATMHHSVL
jgi:hypothetical protein